MTAQSRQRKHKQGMRRTILRAARELFVREGYEGFSMRKLARKIEYSPGTIYLHFENKQALFECLIDESYASLEEVMQGPHERSDPVTDLRKGWRAYVDFGLRNPNHYRLAFMLGRPEETHHFQKADLLFVALRDSVNRCVEQGYFHPVDVDAAAQAQWASVHGITSLLIQRPDFPWVAKEKLVAQVIDSSIDSLLAVSPAAPEKERRANSAR